MQDLLHHYRAIMIFIVFLSLSVCLITFQVRILDHVVLMLFSPVQKVLISFFDKVTDTIARYHLLLFIQDEYEKLKSENIQLKSQLLKTQEVEQQVTRLKELLLLQQAIPYHTIVTTVIAKNPVSPSNTLTIDKGSLHGVRKYQGVITNFGVVGRIIIVSLISSKVQLITDKDCAIAALNQRTRDSGLVRGCGYKNPLLQMDFVFYRAQFSVGDQIITSGLDKVFPKGLPIGEVHRIESQSGDLFYKEIEIQPTVDINRIEEVLVVVNPQTANERDIP